MNNELEQRAREICDKFCPRGNYEHDDVLDAIRAALELGLVLAKPKAQSKHVWCEDCKGVHPERCANAS